MLRGEGLGGAGGAGERGSGVVVGEEGEEGEEGFVVVWRSGGGGNWRVKL